MADETLKPKSALPITTEHEISANTSQHHNNHHYAASETQDDRKGKAIMQSSDPSTEALRRWAADKETHYPGQDGSIDINGVGTMQAMAFGGAVRIPRKGDTLPPPDERLGIGKFGHGQAEYVGQGIGEEDEYNKTVKSEEQNEAKGKEKNKKHSLSALFHRKKQDEDHDSKDYDGETVR